MTDAGRIVLSWASPALAVVTIDRAAKRNALTPTMFDELIEVFAGLGERPGVRACVLTGAGSDFCAGGDVEAFGRLTSDQDRRAQIDRAFGAFTAIEAAPIPVIAAVDGSAHGGGTELALACDLVVASDRASFALPEVSVGLMPGFGLVRMSARVGLQRAALLALTGEAIDATKAYEWGLACAVAASDQLQARARELGGAIAGQPAEAVRAISSWLTARRQDDDLSAVADTIVSLFATEAHQELVRTWTAARDRR